MDRHYTYEEIRKSVFSKNPMNDEILEHILNCEDCLKIFLSISQDIPAEPSRAGKMNILEKIALKRMKVREISYNLRVVFGVAAAMVMLFMMPLSPKEETDIIKKNYEQVSNISEIKEEFRQDFRDNFDKFMEYYTKGHENNDTTKE